MIFCPHCQQPVPDGALTCGQCHTPINQSEIVAANLTASKGAEYVVGGINWGAVVLGGLIALAIWNGGMFLLALLMGADALWFNIIIKITAVTLGAAFAGYRSYSAELTHGLLVAGIVAGVNGVIFFIVQNVELTITVILMDFIFIDMGAALVGSFFGARMQR
jgi:hypothetical protein